MEINKKAKLMWQVRCKIRAMQYSYKTEQSYASWIKRFIHFHNLTHPNQMGAKEVNDFLTYLAVTRKVAPAVSLSPLDHLMNKAKESQFTLNKLSNNMVKEPVLNYA